MHAGDESPHLREVWEEARARVYGLDAVRVRQPHNTHTQHACNCFRDKKRSPLGLTIVPAAQGYIDAGPYALLVLTTAYPCLRPCPRPHACPFLRPCWTCPCCFLRSRVPQLHKLQ
eukprot:237733-Chlamydomonas_euryale.AAC.5